MYFVKVAFVKYLCDKMQVSNVVQVATSRAAKCRFPVLNNLKFKPLTLSPENCALYVMLHQINQFDCLDTIRIEPSPASPTIRSFQRIRKTENDNYEETIEMLPKPLLNGNGARCLVEKQASNSALPSGISRGSGGVTSLRPGIGRLVFRSLLKQDQSLLFVILESFAWSVARDYDLQSGESREAEICRAITSLTSHLLRPLNHLQPSSMP